MVHVFGDKDHGPLADDEAYCANAGEVFEPDEYEVFVLFHRGATWVDNEKTCWKCTDCGMRSDERSAS